MHEPDPVLRSQRQLSFEGFARYLMDSANSAIIESKQRRRTRQPVSRKGSGSGSSNGNSRSSSIEVEEEIEKVTSSRVAAEAEEDYLDHPLSSYYIATTHNTYLAGHQLQG